MGGRRSKKRNQPGRDEDVRTAVRQRAVARTDNATPPDTNEWELTYPQHLVGWLYDVLESLDWKPSVLDVLKAEDEFPGLYSDLSTESWQRKLIRDQIKGSKDDE